LCHKVNLDHASACSMEDATTPNAEELERTREDDLAWLALREETVVFNEVFVDSKYNEIESQDQENQDTDSHKKKNSRGKINETELAHKLIGLVDIEESDFKKNAIEQWSRELLDMCSPTGDSSFLSVVKKRLAVQQRLHSAYLRELTRKEREKGQEKSEEKDTEVDQEYLSVPVVVRLGVLTMFPIIQSLAGIKDANYGRLCSQVLNILSNVLSTLPPLALHDEPADCLDAFEDFILSLIKESDHNVDTPEKSQAVNALVGLVMSRGKAKDLLLLASVLFNINEKVGNRPFQVSQYLKQLSEHEKDMELSVFFERGLRDEWTVNNMQIDSISLDSSIRDVIASDGTFLYTHNHQQGLRKVGSGYGGTIQGQIYEHNPQYKKGEKSKSLAHISGKLYYLLPQSANAAQPLGAPAQPLDEDYEVLDDYLEEEDRDEDDEDGEDMETDEIENVAPPARPPAQNNREGQVEDEEVQLQIVVIDAVTLKEEKVITMREKLAQKNADDYGWNAPVFRHKEKGASSRERADRKTSRAHIQTSRGRAQSRQKCRSGRSDGCHQGDRHNVFELCHQRRAAPRELFGSFWSCVERVPPGQIDRCCLTHQLCTKSSRAFCAIESVVQIDILHHWTPTLHVTALSRQRTNIRQDQSIFHARWKAHRRRQNRLYADQSGRLLRLQTQRYLVFCG